MRNHEIELTQQTIADFIQSQATCVKKMLLHGRPESILPEAASGACFDITVLLAWKIRQNFLKIFLFDLVGLGKDLTVHNGHHVLGFSANTTEFSYADGTIWQIRPQEKEIYVSQPFNSQEQLLEELRDTYTGIWIARDINRCLTRECVKEKIQYLKHRHQRPHRR